MTKKVIEKILKGDIITAKDMTPEEKKELYALFERYGMPQGTCYNRFFRDGFSKWEIMGVTHIKQTFMLTTECGLDDKETPDEGSRGYAYVQTLAPDYNDEKFWTVITDLKMGVRFCEHMAELGMLSQMTVRSRFPKNDWKPWELVGVQKIMQEYGQTAGA